MRKYKIIIEENAWHSIDKITNFILSYNFNYSQKVLKNFLKSIQSLEYFPNRNSYLYFNKNYRKMLFLEKYIIIYSVDNIRHIVYIKYVFCTRQNYFKSIS